MNSGAPEGKAVPAPLVTPIVLISYKPGDKLRTRKWPGSVYDKWNISIVICDTDIP